MSGNTFGQLFTVTTCGESHGAGLLAIVDGCPPGLSLSEADLQAELDRRKPGTSKYTSQRRETDAVKILSGIFEGVTTGTPIGLLIENVDAKSKDYEAIKDKFRPGHADFTYLKKYGIRDYRGGGRASARETVMRVAAGAIAKKYLFEKYQIEIFGFLKRMGEVELQFESREVVSGNPFYCGEASKVSALEEMIDKVRREGDSIGAEVEVRATNMLAGLGEPVFHKLDADIATAMMGIPAAKGVEIGAGFESVIQKGTEHRDEMTPEGFLSNHAGGVLGGISSGQDLVARVAFKPASSLPTPAKTVTVSGEATEIVTKGRHDPCVGIRGVPITEAMLALVLMDHVMRYRAQADSAR